jgi:hypothetical protein
MYHCSLWAQNTGSCDIDVVMHYSSKFGKFADEVGDYQLVERALYGAVRPSVRHHIYLSSCL